MRGTGAPSEARFLRNRHISADPNDGSPDDSETRREVADDGVPLLSPPLSLDTCVTLSSSETETAYLDDSRDAAETKKEMPFVEEATEIDSVVSCLTAVGRCFVRDGGVRVFRVALVLLLCASFALYRFAPLHTKWALSLLERVLYFGRFHPQLPVLGAICTHHRSGTVLFLSVGEQWCSSFFMDYERVEDPFQLQKPSSTKTLEYLHYDGAKEKLVVGMHGFYEKCVVPEEEEDLCGLFEAECWMQSCNIKTQRKRKEIPVVHVVRNPVEVLISAYLYHQKDEPVPEGWLADPKPDALVLLPAEIQERMQSVPYYQVLQQLPPDYGLRVEYTVEMEDLFRMARNYRDLAMSEYGLNIKYEEILNDFEGVMDQVASHLTISEKFPKAKVLEVTYERPQITVNVENVHNMTKTTRTDYSVDMHVTEGKHDKDSLRQALYADDEMRQVLMSLADVLDYPDPFSMSIT